MWEHDLTQVFCWAGVNQQPPIHQLRMRPLKPFWGWTKNTSSLAKVIHFFSLFSAPEFFPPTYLPWFCAHSIARAQEQRQNSRAVGARPELGSSWNGSIATIARLKRAHELHCQSSDCENFGTPEAKPRRDPELELEDKLPPLSPSLCFYFGHAATKKVMTKLPSPSLLQQAFFSFLFVVAQKVTATTLPSPFVLVLLLQALFLFFVAGWKAMATTLQSPSILVLLLQALFSFLFVTTRKATASTLQSLSILVLL